MKGISKSDWNRHKRINPPGKIIEGQVIFAVPDSGIEVRLMHNEGYGYIRRREVEWAQNKVGAEINEGAWVKAVVTGFDDNHKRISLSFVEMNRSLFLNRYQIGDIVEGKVVNPHYNGIFVELDFGMQGFIHRDEIPFAVEKPINELLRKEDTIQAILTQVEINDSVDLSITKLIEQQNSVINTISTSRPTEDINIAGSFKDTFDPMSGIDGDGITVLYVEDEEDAAKTVQKTLNKCGFSVSVAHDRESAIRIFKEQPEIGFLILDLNLVGDNGIFLARDLLTINKNIKILIVTAFLNKSNIKYIRDDIYDNIIDVLFKPCSPLDIAVLLLNPDDSKKIDLLISGLNETSDSLSKEKRKSLLRVNSPIKHLRAMIKSIHSLIPENCSILILCLDPLKDQLEYIDGINFSKKLFTTNEHDIKFSPVMDIFTINNMVYTKSIPSDSDRYNKLLNIVAFKSFAGYPLSIMSEPLYGCYLFMPEEKQLSESISNSIENHILRTENILERIEFERKIILSQKLYNLGNLFVGLSHELKNNLYVLNTTLESLKLDITRLSMSQCSSLIAGEMNNSINEVLKNTKVIKECVDLIPPLTGDEDEHRIDNQVNVFNSMDSINKNVSILKDRISGMDVGEDRDEHEESMKIAIGVFDAKIRYLKDTMISVFDLLKESKMSMNINLQINRLEKLLKTNYQEKNILIEKDLDPILYESDDFDATFQLVLFNLLINSYNNTFRKNTKVQIKASRFQKEGMTWARISVSDQGSGIHKRLHKKVFSPFYTTREEGSGLGLSIARNIVESMGGDIFIEKSVMFIGTEFIVEIPLLVEENAN